MPPTNSRKRVSDERRIFKAAFCVAVIQMVLILANTANNVTLHAFLCAIALMIVIVFWAVYDK